MATSIGTSMGRKVVNKRRHCRQKTNHTVPTTILWQSIDKTFHKSVGHLPLPQPCVMAMSQLGSRIALTHNSQQVLCSCLMLLSSSQTTLALRTVPTRHPPGNLCQEESSRDGELSEILSDRRRAPYQNWYIACIETFFHSAVNVRTTLD